MDASAELEERTLRMVHLFNASPERLFADWTNPRQFMQWFGPHGMTNRFCEVDLSVGGTWRLEAEGRGTRRPCRESISRSIRRAGGSSPGRGTNWAISPRLASTRQR